ncbi:MAG TPA: DUF4360 domain-containing protein [Pilimelia sp.]|nr:DUF4360 domain-containing protein [Pilimelia sp.]
MRFSAARIGRRRLGVLAVTTLVAGTGIVAVSGSPAAADPAPPPTGKVLVELVKANGSGCKKNTTVVAISPDKEAFTVVYSTYMAVVGIGTKPPDARRTCKIDVKLSPPPGYTYAIAQVDYRGFAFLEGGATAVERAKYKFQGGPDRSLIEHPFAGPFDDFWQTTDLTEPGSLIFGDCGKSRTMNIDTELEVRVGTSDPETTTSFIAMDSTDGVIDTTYHIAWKTCH